MCNKIHDRHVVGVVLGCRALLTGTEGLHRLKDAQHQQGHGCDLLEPPSDALRAAVLYGMMSGSL